MAQVRELTEDEARELSDQDGAVFLGKSYQDKSISLWYEVGGKFIEVWVTNDSARWVFGGVEYDSREDVDLP